MRCGDEQYSITYLDLLKYFQLSLNENRNRGTMTELPVNKSQSMDDILAEQLASMEARSLEDVRRTINAIADEIYRPPWK